MTNGSLMKAESIAECSPWSILQNFWPALSYIIGLENQFSVFLRVAVLHRLYGSAWLSGRVLQASPALCPWARTLILGRKESNQIKQTQVLLYIKLRYAGHLIVFLDVEKVLLAQTFGGLMFALFGGTPQIVLLTTAPLALYTKSNYSF